MAYNDCTALHQLSLFVTIIMRTNRNVKIVFLVYSISYTQFKYCSASTKIVTGLDSSADAVEQTFKK